jgi:hypothetical protein
MDPIYIQYIECMSIIRLNSNGRFFFLSLSSLLIFPTRILHSKTNLILHLQ